ncbi:MAG: U32 family peptidase [Clostridia bacterium]|nr:U32 family peptidase [Clostridia bacterium]
MTERVYLPIFRFPNLDSYERVGVVIPLVIKDSEREEVESELRRLYNLGVRRAYAENLGGVKIARALGFEILGGVRLNVYNSYTAKVYSDLGIGEVMLSPELTPPQKRDFVKVLPVGETLYGRLPLMIMENCIMNLRDGCRECTDFKLCRKSVVLQDRQGVRFPVFPEYFHRCQIFNSVPAFSGDKKPTDGVSFRVIFITDEKDSVNTVKEVISGKPPTKEFTRKG